MGYLYSFIAGCLLMGYLMDHNRQTNKQEDREGNDY